MTDADVQEERARFAALQPHEVEMFMVLVRDRRGVLKLSRHAYTKFYELANATGHSATEKRKLRERVKGAVAVFLQSPRVDELYGLASAEGAPAGPLRPRAAPAPAPAASAPAPATSAPAPAPVAPQAPVAPAPAPTAAAPSLVAPPPTVASVPSAQREETSAAAPKPAKRARKSAAKRAAKSAVKPVAPFDSLAALPLPPAPTARAAATRHAPPPGTRVAVRYDDKYYEGTVADALDEHRATVKFDDGSEHPINFTEPGIRIITRAAPAPAPAPVAPPPAAAAPAPMEMSTEPSPVVAAAAPAPANHVPLLAGVRLFMFGARDQLNSYDLRHLSEVPDGDRPPAPADLTNIANFFRESPSSNGGLDAVALGLCGCEVDKPVVFALQTLTVVGTDTVRISKTAVDMTLMPHLPLQSLLDHFAAQVPRFARQLLPGARYVACEKVDSSRTGYLWDPDSQRHLPFEIWQPGPGYASVFPSNATGVAFLRADLNAPGAAATA